MDYLYDGSFDGFLTCVYYHYKIQNASRIHEKKNYQGSLLDDFKEIETDYNFSKIVYNAIENKISRYSMRTIYYAFLSSSEEKDTKLLNYIIFGFKIGEKIDNIYSHPLVLPVMEMSKKVGFEAHRFLGYIRFAEVNGILFAKCRPDNNIVPVISEHFADRYKYEKFIIYDEKRKIASIYSNNHWEIVETGELRMEAFSEDEVAFQKLWKRYFEVLAIDDRKNDKLQTQLVPKRYRCNLVEFT